MTGANRGIGLEFVRQYAARQWRVFATCRRPTEALELKAVAGDVRIHALDVADDGQITDLAGTLAGEPLDVLINNAGVAGARSRQDSDPAAWLDVLRVNAIAPIRVAQHFVEHLERGAHRKIVSISSSRASIGGNRRGGFMMYRTSKAALNMAMRCLAADLKPRGIIVVAFAPGWVNPVAPQQSVSAMRRLIAGLKPEHSGGFFSTSGKRCPW